MGRELRQRPLPDLVSCAVVSLAAGTHQPAPSLPQHTLRSDVPVWLCNRGAAPTIETLGAYAEWSLRTRLDGS